MKITTTSIAISVLLMGSVFASVASASNVTAEREARTFRIEALTQDVASDRLTRAQKILVQQQIARLKAEGRKLRRLQDRIRDRQAALNRRGHY